MKDRFYVYCGFKNLQTSIKSFSWSTFASAQNTPKIQPENKFESKNKYST